MNGNAVRVVLWGETVGYLIWDSSSWRTTTAVFSFAREFIEKGLDISPLMMPLQSYLVQSGQSIRGKVLFLLPVAELGGGDACFLFELRCEIFRVLELEYDGYFLDGS